MNVTKQIVYISKNKNANELEKLLTLLSQLNQNNPECVHSSIYGCDDESNEFLLYEQWKSEKSFELFRRSNLYKDFEEKSRPFLHRVELLRLD